MASAKPGMHGAFWFLFKVARYIYVFMWLRFTFPRYRFDQLMRLGWQFLVPLSIVNVVASPWALALHRQLGWPLVPSLLAEHRGHAGGGGVSGVRSGRSTSLRWSGKRERGAARCLIWWSFISSRRWRWSPRILVVTRRNAVQSAIFLATALLATAGIFLSLHAEFLFIVQMILYAGGIMVLFVFVIMLVNLDVALHQVQFNRQWLVALLLALVLGGAGGCGAGGEPARACIR